MAAASPSTEAARLAALNRYAILDSEPEQSFDDLSPWPRTFAKHPWLPFRSWTTTGNGSNPN